MSRKLKTLDEFVINESVIGKFTTMTADEMRLVAQCSNTDLGDRDTRVRSAIIKAIEVNYEYFEGDGPKDINLRTAIIEAAMDEQKRDRLVGIAKTFVGSLEKINRIEESEIEPLISQIESSLS